MKVNVGVSNRHVHLNNEDYKLLFGDTPLTKRNDLTQPGCFASDLLVTITGPKRSVENVRVLGPNRSYTQVEVSKTDSYTLGINPPVRNSGDLIDAVEITITGPLGSITRNAAIIASRHIHVDKNIIKEHNLEGIEKVSVKIPGEKGGIIDNVYLKETEEAYFELHLDTDDANAHLLKQGDEVEIIIK
jgi:propanediol utilization protein